MASEPLGH